MNKEHRRTLLDAFEEVVENIFGSSQKKKKPPEEV